MKMYIKNWICKKKFIIKETFKRFPKMIGTLLSCFGVILTVAESVQYLFDTDLIYKFMHTYVIAIIFTCMIVSIEINKEKLQFEYMLKGTDVKLTLKVADVLNNIGAIVIPTNTTFDTLMEDEFISVNSVQGQFQKKYFDNNLCALDDLLEKGLEGFSYEQIERTKSKCKRYPLGTVCKVTYNKVHYYFVAIADVNKYGKPVNTSFENIQVALEGIWNQIENRGHIENLSIPLLGTGKAGIKDATREKVIKEIIFSFVVSSQERKITENLSICIHPLDLEQKELDLQDLNDYLRYMCSYRYADGNNGNEGGIAMTK